MAVSFSDIFAAPARQQEASAAHELPLPGSTPVFLASAEPEPSLNISLIGHLVFLVVIFVLSVLTIEFARLSNQIATVWPANAVMLAMVLRYTRSPANYLSIVVAGSAATGLASLLIGNGPVLSSVLFATNIIEVGCALTLLTIFQINTSNLASFRGILVFIVVAGGVAPIVSTLLSAIAYGGSFGRPWFVIWRNWYPGHALGMIIVVPFLISITSQQWRALRIRQQISGSIAVFAVFVAIGLCATYFRPGIFAVAPAILLATVRFGVIGATASTFAIAIVASAFAVMDIGQPFIMQPEVAQRVFALQMFLAITSFWSLPTAALLTERDRLLHGLARANKQLTAESERKSHLVTGLRRHLSMAEENERLRLSHELHDQAGQSLIAAILELNEIDALTTGPAHERLRHLRKKMEEMGGTLHRIAWELRPPSIDELGLRKALASYIAEWSAQCGTEVDFHCDDPSLDEVPDEIATAVYRVVQEGLTNIVKHAQRPSDVSVVIRQPEATLQVIVEDNGCGFDTAALGSKGGNHRGLGLDGMRERLALLGGTLVVESAIGAGTTIFARIDLDSQRSAA